MTTGFHATDRSLLRISGGDAAKFLGDLVTNEIAPEGLTYAALLTPQGKYLSDFLIHADEDEFVLDVDAGQVAGLAQRLGMYKLRAEVTIEADDQPVWVVFGGEAGLVDPRHEALGRRVYGSLDGVEHANPDTFETARILQVIPKSGAELVANDSYILESGFERVHGVDFKKGCYVGQEVTARMKHKTALRKGLIGVRLSAPDVPIGTDIMSGGNVCGTLTSCQNHLGIAYMRFDRMGHDMTAGGAAVTTRDPGEA